MRFTSYELMTSLTILTYLTLGCAIVLSFTNIILLLTRSIYVS